MGKVGRREREVRFLREGERRILSVAKVVVKKGDEAFSENERTSREERDEERTNRYPLFERILLGARGS